MLFLIITSSGWSASDGNPTNGPAGGIESQYEKARAAWHANPDDPEAAWKLGRAAFDMAELARSNSERAHLAEQGIIACRQALHENPGSAPAHYYLALNLGQMARTEKLGALQLVHQMEAEFKAAIALDPSFDYAGADRSLGLLYRDAPGWPMSIGNRTKSREHLLRAVQLAPNYPDNWLTLLESYLHWDEKGKVRDTLGTVEAKLKEARQKLAGPRWQSAWQDWDRRFEKIKTKAGAATYQSPRTRDR